MTPEAFVAKWAINTRNEAAAAKEHFLDPLPAPGRAGAE